MMIRYKTKFKTKKYIIGKLNYKFLFFVFSWALFGLLMLLSASTYESEKATNSPHSFFFSQGWTMLFSLSVMLLVSLIDYRYFRRLGWVLSIVSLISLILVDFSSLGIIAGGSQRWLSISGFSFQPSELAKISSIILLADGLSVYDWNSKKILPHYCVCLLMAFLILKEPDLGTSVLVLSTSFSLLLMAGFNLFLALLSILGGFAGIWFSINNNAYQLERLQGWLNPEKDPLGKGYNLLESYYAIASGQLWGVGHGNSVLKSGYLPISYADFIFAVICEELGIIGSMVVLGFFLYLMWTGIDIVLKVPGNFGRLLGLGIITCLIIQAIFNLGGVVGLLPVTGMPLPLISYGKTSLVVTGFMLGIILNLSKHKYI